MSALPTIFVSHGSPMLAIQDTAARRFLQDLGTQLPRPKSILVVSAHWETSGAPAVSFVSHPETIHDFGGFPAGLYDIQYRAPGAPALAEQVISAFNEAAVPVGKSDQRGLDHGAWVPLSLMYPDADLPVTQISLLRGATPYTHEKIGKVLAQLRHEGVLVIGSGSMTHNLYELRQKQVGAETPLWVVEFDRWMREHLEKNDRDALHDYRNRAPSAHLNHPTEEHLLPLFVAMGAAGDGAHARLLHSSIEHGVLAMDAYSFQ